MEVVQLAIVENNANSEGEDAKVEDVFKWGEKEKELIERLEARHCRPLVNLC